MSRPVSPLDKGLATASAAIDLLIPSLSPSDQKYGWTLEQATSRLDHLSQSQTDWRVTAAYLACQVWAYRNISGSEERDAARMALHAIESALLHYRERESAAKQAPVEPEQETLL